MEDGKTWHERIINPNISLEEVGLQTFEMHKLSKLCKLAPPGTPLLGSCFIAILLLSRSTLWLLMILMSLIWWPDGKIGHKEKTEIKLGKKAASV